MSEVLLCRKLTIVTTWWVCSFLFISFRNTAVLWKSIHKAWNNGQFMSKQHSVQWFYLFIFNRRRSRQFINMPQKRKYTSTSTQWDLHLNKISVVEQLQDMILKELLLLILETKYLFKRHSLGRTGSLTMHLHNLCFKSLKAIVMFNQFQSLLCLCLLIRPDFENHTSTLNVEAR